jgi:hypothetical protein
MDPQNAPNLAREALDNLVHQFARPMDFLRELVQNSIDAGTPRVDVWVRYQADHGVLEVHVDDYGEGMDEAIVDDQLTRMFSSTKEGDLTKIGKFGIGFTSVFAIGPEAVLVHTGRHGEAWELLFHADRSFDKTRLDHPVSGTHITIYEQLPAERVADFVRQCRWVLRYWCRHSDTPITFHDRTVEQERPEALDEDPFAAFDDPGPEAAVGGDAAPESINEPLGLRGRLQHHTLADGVEVVVGYGDSPAFGYFNGGLTLIETGNPEVLGRHMERLAHLSFEVKYDALEHTLTRDNVLHDEAFEHAMAVVTSAARALRGELLERLDRAVREREPLEPWLELVALECANSRAHEQIPDFARRCKLHDVTGRVVSLREIEAQEAELGVILLSGGDASLLRAVLDAGHLVTPDSPATRRLLQAAFEPSALPFGRKQRRLVTLPELFCLAEPVEPERVSPDERRLLESCEVLLEHAVGKGVRVVLGHFRGGDDPERMPLALEGPLEGGLFQRLRPGLVRLPLFVRSRRVLLDREHPTFHALLVASRDDPHIAAASLAHLLLDAADVRRDGPWVKVIEEAWSQALELAP